MGADEGQQLYKFEQIRDMIIHKIENGGFKKNNKLPSIATVCETYGLSKVTVGRAYMHLKKRDYIYYEPGKGHFVR